MVGWSTFDQQNVSQAAHNLLVSMMYLILDISEVLQNLYAAQLYAVIQCCPAIHGWKGLATYSKNKWVIHPHTKGLVRWRRSIFFYSKMLRPDEMKRLPSPKHCLQNLWIGTFANHDDAGLDCDAFFCIILMGLWYEPHWTAHNVVNIPKTITQNSLPLILEEYMMTT